MKNTIAQLYTKLSEYGTVYNKFAPDSASYPYMVFDFIVANTNFKTQTADLTVNIWSDSMQESIELQDEVWKGMDGYSYSGDTSLYVRQSFATTIEDVDPTINRRQVSFMVLFEEE